VGEAFLVAAQLSAAALHGVEVVAELGDRGGVTVAGAAIVPFLR
jgi:hypothetical protein